MSLIYGPSGQQMVALGGENSWRTHRKGDVVCALQWAGKTAEDIEPAMCLFPNVGNTRAGAFVLCLSSLFKYVDSKTGYATPALRERGWQDIARQLGLDAISRNVRADICTVIEDASRDLVHMPPAPPRVVNAAAEPKVGVMEIRNKGGRVLHEVEV